MAGFKVATEVVNTTWQHAHLEMYLLSRFLDELRYRGFGLVSVLGHDPNQISFFTLRMEDQLHQVITGLEDLQRFYDGKAPARVDENAMQLMLPRQ
jgi:hypothetical protein